MKKKNIHRFPRWETFREAVEKALARSPIPAGRYTFYTEAFEDIVSVFVDTPDVPESRRPMNGQIGSELGAMAREITLSSMLAKTPREPYFSIAHILRDALRPRGLIPSVFATDERWIDAIQIALTYNERKDPQTSGVPQFQPSDVTFAHAVHFFNDKGIEVPLLGDNVVIQSSRTWAALAATVLRPLIALGDTLAMQYVGEWLSMRFDPVLNRVHLHPTPDLMGRKMDRSLPCGYVYRAAIKALGRPRTPGGSSAKPGSIATAATHLAALYEVEPFSGYETMFPPYPDRIFEVLVRVALYDELFTIPQCDPARVEQLLRDLFEEDATAEAADTLGWTLDDVVALWRLLLSITPRSATSTFINRLHLRLQLGQRVGRAACDALLKALVLSSPNETYRLPSDAQHADTRECAIVDASANRYWIAPQPFLGPAFFARLVSCYARADKRISSKIGMAFEARMLRRMTELGIQCRRAEVVGSKGAKAGDVDLIIETKDVIAIFELKKKGLTRKTNAGNDLQLATDLARGLVHAVNQLARHEITLLRREELLFVDGTGLSLDGRRIVKCVISLADYGGFHDGAILRNMMKSFCQITLRPSLSLSEEQRAGLDEANREIKTLQSRYSEFAKFVPSGSNVDLFDNLLFHNVFFVEYLLQTESTAEAVLQTLLLGNRMITGTRDPFFDQDRWNSGRT